MEYEHLYYKMTQYDMKLPHTALTFKRLDDTTINDNKRKLALVLGNSLHFETMKTALKHNITISSVLVETLQNFL